MKICTKCRTSNPDDAPVCCKCGEDITKKYIRQHRVKHKGHHSHPAKKEGLPKSAIIFGTAIFILFIIALLLTIYHSW